MTSKYHIRNIEILYICGNYGQSENILKSETDSQYLAVTIHNELLE